MLTTSLPHLLFQCLQLFLDHIQLFSQFLLLCLIPLTIFSLSGKVICIHSKLLLQDFNLVDYLRRDLLAIGCGPRPGGQILGGCTRTWGSCPKQGEMGKWLLQGCMLLRLLVLQSVTEQIKQLQ